jgi:hypothetical protein
MAEPTSTGSVGLAALAVALIGPMAGPYALIVFAGLAGAMLPLSARLHQLGCLVRGFCCAAR